MARIRLIQAFCDYRHDGDDDFGDVDDNDYSDICDDGNYIGIDDDDDYDDNDVNDYGDNYD